MGVPSGGWVAIRFQADKPKYEIITPYINANLDTHICHIQVFN